MGPCLLVLLDTVCADSFGNVKKADRKALANLFKGCQGLGVYVEALVRKVGVFVVEDSHCVAVEVEVLHEGGPF